LLCCPGGDLCSRGEIEFAQGLGDVLLDRALGEIEILGYPAVGEPASEHSRHFAFPGGEGISGGLVCNPAGRLPPGGAFHQESILFGLFG
jgi:hypothetical protein